LVERKLGEFDKEYVLRQAKEQYERGVVEKVDLNPKKTAVIVVDLIEEFTKPEATSMLPKVKKLLDVCRKVGVRVIYTYYDFGPTGLTANGIIGLTPIGKASPKFAGKIFNKETIDPMIKPQYNIDIVLPKYSYGSFRSTPLNNVLRNLGIETVIVCGTMTNYCCGLTARQAVDYGYKLVFGSDINATDDPDIQKAELKTIRRGYGLVLTCEEIIRVLENKVR
jgi:nicotinamidase-related amidase